MCDFHNIFFWYCWYDNIFSLTHSSTSAKILFIYQPTLISLSAPHISHPLFPLSDPSTHPSRSQVLTRPPFPLTDPSLPPPLIYTLEPIFSLLASPFCFGRRKSFSFHFPLPRRGSPGYKKCPAAPPMNSSDIIISFITLFFPFHSLFPKYMLQRFPSFLKNIDNTVELA